MYKMPPVRRTFASCIRASASAKSCDHLAVNKVDSWVSNKSKNPGKPCNFKVFRDLETRFNYSHSRFGFEIMVLCVLIWSQNAMILFFFSRVILVC